MFDHLWISLDPSSQLSIRRVLVALAFMAMMAVLAKPGQRMIVFVVLATLAFLISVVLAKTEAAKIQRPDTQLLGRSRRLYGSQRIDEFDG